MFIIPVSKPISLADPSFTSKTVGEVVVDIVINDKLYKGFILSVLKSLVSEVIMGKDFLKRHKKVVFE